MPAESIFLDARVVFRNALFHRGRYQASVNGLWSVKSSRDGEMLHYSLVLKREKLVEAKPVLSDFANNIVHCLDLTIAACAQSYGSERSHKILFPFSPELKAFEARLRKLEGLVHEEYLEAILEIARNLQSMSRQLAEVKEISNSSKHWKLLPISTKSFAVAMNENRSQQIVEFPPDHFDREDTLLFHSSSEPLRNAVTTLIGENVVFDNNAKGQPPGTLFEYSTKYADDIISACEAVEQRLGE
jgi:hypothetical protein